MIGDSFKLLIQLETIVEEKVRKMTVLLIWTWVVKPEKQREHKRLLTRFQEYVKKNPKTFKELKSMRFFTQTFGGISGAYVEHAEFESLSGLASCLARASKDKGYIKIDQEWMSLLDPATLTSNLYTVVT